MGRQGIAVPAVVGLFVEEQHIQFAVRLFALLQGDGQRQVRRAETDADQVVNDGRSNCLCHFQCPLDEPLNKGGEPNTRGLSRTAGRLLIGTRTVK
jgi:hypothetical protein